VSINPELFQLPQAEGLAQRCEHWLLDANNDQHLLLVAESAGQIVGSISATLYSPMESAARQMVRDVGLTRLVINALLVQQSYWRHGIGTRLMHDAEAWGRAKGASVVLLDTYVNSPVSVPFYETHLDYQRRAIHFRKRLAD
jgi:GNAT superfamily N-acetyltransferase